MPNSAYYHKELLPENLSLMEAEQVLEKHFENCILIGVDEAGRGPIAGPVVAAATTIARTTAAIAALNDSKKLTANQREKIFAELPNHCKHYSIAEASAQEIDELGILNANFLAMRRALEPIISSLNGEYKILVDGNLCIRGIDESLQMPIIKGDGRVACIAAASIFAKVHRDRLMVKFSEQFPGLRF